MRVTADTNVIISGLFWRGNRRAVLDAARDGIIDLFTSETLLDELRDVLDRDRFAGRVTAIGATVDQLVDGIAALATVVDTVAIVPIISRDPDDDHVLACAMSAECEIIVSGDDDLLSLESYQGIRIMNAPEFLKLLYL